MEAGKERFRKGEMQEMRESGKEGIRKGGFKKGGMQERRNAGRGKQERRSGARKEGIRKKGMQVRRESGREECRKGGSQERWERSDAGRKNAQVFDLINLETFIFLQTVVGS